MPDTRFEDRVRESLRSQAEVPLFDSGDPRKVAGRVRRRLLRNGVVVSVVILVALFVAIAFIPRFDRSIPADPMPIGPRGDGEIAFTQGTDLFAIGSDGAGRVHLAQGCTGTTCRIDSVAWSPEGTEVVFAHYSEKGGGELGPRDGPLYLVAPDGDGLRALTSCHWPYCWDDFAAWSPDGSRVAFIRHGESPDGAAGVLYVIDSDGSNLIRLSSPGVYPSPPTWSPDGSRIAYVAGGARIMVAAADGTVRSVLVHGSSAGELHSIAWSPDGEKLAYASYVRSAPQDELWVIGPDGGDPHLMITSARGMQPVWSPDGSRLAVVASGSLIVMKPDATGRVRLASGRIRSPVWSPSGSMLAAFLHNQLVVVSVDGSGMRTVAPVNLGGMIAWQPVVGNASSGGRVPSGGSSP
jgi:Tol biopolymer transport system component